VIVPLVYESKETTENALLDVPVYLCTGSPAKFGIGAPVGCSSHSQAKMLIAAGCRNSRGEDEAETAVHFSVNNVADLFPDFIGLFEFARVTLNPQPNPGPIGRSLSVTTINHPDAADVLTFLRTGVGALP
jgi:hypothetical protein